MLLDLRNGYTLLSGRVCTDAKYTLTPNKGTPVCTVAVSALGRDAQLCNVKAFYELAMVMEPIKKGDSLFAVVRKQDNEYNGKTYTDYICEFVSIASANQAAAVSAPAAQEASATTMFSGEYITLGADEPLPF